MTASQSALSQGAYGYDVVVATTQASINATLKEYLSTGEPAEAVQCYVADQNGNPMPIDYATLVANAKGTDPFTIPDKTDPATSPELKNLYAARFMAGFKARLGLPPGYAPAEIPDIVVLGANTSTVTYNLMCSEFVVTQYTPGSGYTPAAWMNVSQDPGKAWLFTSRVNLSLTPTSDYGTLPANVQGQIKDLGGNAFSVQQLLFDLDSAALETLPTISGVDTGSSLFACLQKDFVGSYFAAMKVKQSPMLCCAVTQSDAPSTLALSDLNFWSSPFVGANGQAVANPTAAQQGAYTLNYLCAVSGDALPAPAQFAWNWVDESEVADVHGVVAINRNTFVRYLRTQLDPVAAGNCFVPSVQIAVSGVANAAFNLDMTASGTPTVTVPPSGPLLLGYSWTPPATSDQAGLGGDVGSATLTPSYTMAVEASGTTVTITQHLIVKLQASKNLISNESGNVVDRMIMDVYTLAVDAGGALDVQPHSTVTDNSQDTAGGRQLNIDIVGLDSDVAPIVEKSRSMAATSLKNIPLQAFQGFVFPGGKTFVFKDAAFSDSQDLVAHITYADPA